MRLGVPLTDTQHRGHVRLDYSAVHLVPMGRCQIDSGQNANPNPSPSWMPLSWQLASLLNYFVLKNGLAK
jgi:hypothetical protein